MEDKERIVTETKTFTEKEIVNLRFDNRNF